MLESAYATCLHRELTTRNLRFVTQRRVPIVYKGITLDCEYRLDLFVEDQAQLLTYLRLVGLPVGLVVNFNVDQLVKGVKRVINPRWDDGKVQPFTFVSPFLL